MAGFNPLDHPISFARPLRIDSTSAWLEHVPFGMLLIDLVRPKVLVELGTHTGISYCAFCQAVMQLGLETRCFAVDTWEGDPQAGFYGPDVLGTLRAYHDPLYGGFSRLVQEKFDDAIKYFPDGSIDLLHIDGLHTYEAVKHDFETWLPKLSERGVVMFHDTNVRERDFGVWKLWAELGQKYPHFEFIHGHGLGIARVGRKPVPGLEPWFAMSDEETQRLRGFFFSLGAGLSNETQKQAQRDVLAAQAESLTTHANELAAQVADREKAIQELKDHAAGLAAQVADREQALTEHVADQQKAAQEFNAELERRAQEIQAINTRAEQVEKDLTAKIDEWEKVAVNLTTNVVDLKATVAEQQSGLEAWQREVAAFQKDREERIKIAEALEQQILELKKHDAELQKGLALRLVSTYRSGVERILPAGSIRRILYGRVMHAVRTVVIWALGGKKVSLPEPRPGPYVPESKERVKAEAAPLKLIAFYRPPRSWSLANVDEGAPPVTAWEGLSKVLPQFAGHLQPRVPGDLGPYDPMSPKTWKRQVELAKNYGIHGFCFQFHWPSTSEFENRYIDKLASNPPGRMPFCLCWESEIGSTGEAGLPEDTSVAGRRLEEAAQEFMRRFKGALRRKNYIRIDNRPVIVVNNIQFLSEVAHLGRSWRRLAREAGIGDLYLIASQSLGPLDPREIGFDAAIEYPPGGIEIGMDDIAAAQTRLNLFYFGRVYRYADLASRYLLNEDGREYKLFRNVLTGWDDEPQLPGQGTTMVFSSALAYKDWLVKSAKQTIEVAPPDERMVFINAWNDWGNGAFLEPDDRYGYAHLQATADALRDLVAPATATASERAAVQPAVKAVKHHDTAVILHLYYPDMWPEIHAHLKNLGNDFDLYVSIPKTVAFSTTLILSEFPQATIYRCENRGRDIAGFAALFAAIQPLAYKYVCKIHTKKSPHLQSGEAWRQDMLQKTLGSPEIIAAAKRILAEQEDAGLVAPKGRLVPATTNWEPNAARVKQLAEEANVPWNGTEFQFVAGSMFWFRPEALHLLTHMRLGIREFEPEQGQLDGTLAHAIERFMGLLALRSGYRIVELDEQVAVTVNNQAPVEAPPPVTPEIDPELLQDPIIVYQMGKVGSTSVAESVAHSYRVKGLFVPVYHIHVLDNLEWIADRMKEDRENPEDSLTGLAQARGLRKEMQQDPDKVWRVISMVRDPVARNVGTFFHNLGELMPDWEERHFRGELEVDELHEFFLGTKLIHRVPGIWFDEQMKTVFGIDVFDSPFPCEAGYKIYNVHWVAGNPITRTTPLPRQLRRTPLMVLRLEDFNRVADQAMREFLGMKDFRFVSANVGEDKAYAALYRAFKSKPLPKQYVEGIYSTRYARHFYTETELEGFARRWTGTPEVESVVEPA